MNKDFWKHKRVLLTGHTGFKGSWLTLYLQQSGATVYGYSHPAPTVPSLFADAQVADGIADIRGDVRDAAALHEAVATFRPEIVFHMAAQPLVRYSYQEPIETFATNVMGTAHLLDAVRQVGGVRAAIVVTSDKCYANREWVWGYRENEAMGGHDPYSASKGCAELVTAAYRSSYFNTETFAQHGVALASGRAGNVIGGGDWATDRLIPDIMRAFIEGRPVIIRNPHAIRPWQHVLDALSGYLLLAEQIWEQGTQYAEGWNFGPADEDCQPVGWIVERMAALWGDDAIWQIDPGTNPHEANFLKLDCSQARQRLGWRPTLTLPVALEWTVEWFRAYASRADMRGVTLGQIERYVQMQSAKEGA